MVLRQLVLEVLEMRVQTSLLTERHTTHLEKSHSEQNPIKTEAIASQMLLRGAVEQYTHLGGQTGKCHVLHQVSTSKALTWVLTMERVMLHRSLLTINTQRQKQGQFCSCFFMLQQNWLTKVKSM